MPTLVVKFLDTVSLLGFTHSDYAKVLAVPETYYEAAKLATTRTTYPVSYPTAAVESVLTIIEERGLKLEFLFTDTTPGQLGAIVNQAADRSKNGTYSFANFFNYFKIVAEPNKLVAVWEKLTPYILTDLADYEQCPLDCVYWRQPAELAQSLGCDPDTATRQDFWNSMGILDFWKNQPVDSLFDAQKTPLTIHCVEYRWAAHTAFPDWVTVSDEPHGHGSLHGCAVLGILVAQWPENKPPEAIDEGKLQGIVPMVQIRTYPAFTEYRIDDALAQAIFKAADHPGDLILLEMDLEGMPDYDLRDGLEDKEANKAVGLVPLELDQAMFELIQVATRGLNLIVIEPVGNGQMNLDKLRIELPEIDQTLDAALTKTPIEVRNYLRNRLIPPSSRHIGYDSGKDSGAIMVGAVAERAAEQWMLFDKTNYGERVDVFAPGKAVLTTFPEGRNATGTGVICQTSAATAIMAGVIAALQVVQRHKFPDRPLNAAQIRTALRTSLATDWLGPFQIPNLNQMSTQFIA